MRQTVEPEAERGEANPPAVDRVSDVAPAHKGFSKAVQTDRPDWIFWALSSLAVLYAFFAGLRTTADFDLGWQLATGRYVLQHHVIPSVDVLSYTANGKPWIYPAFGGVALYLVSCLGGFAALSWFGAFVCAGTTFVATRHRSRAAAAFALIAVPAIAFRTAPRSEMFTTILFAAFLLILWRHYDRHTSALWTLPIMMVAWVNLHTGFVAGLAVIGAYLVVESCELLYIERRAAVLARLRVGVPWLLATVIATFLNPWGWHIYRAILSQNSAMDLHSRIIGEWAPVHFSMASWLQALSFRDPASADWWMLVLATVAIGITLARKEIGPALVLGVGSYESLDHLRMQGLFAILVCIVGATIFSRAARNAQVVGIAPGSTDRTSAWLRNGEFLRGASVNKLAEWAIVALLGAMALVRIADLVTNHYYLYADQISLFGAGESWWFPERAADFLLRENLPSNVFSDYNLGGFLTWRIGPKYPDYFDGRFLPFGEALFARQSQLVASPLDSSEWQEEADARNIQTVIFSAARFAGLANFPLAQDCRSQKWAPVYLDDVAAIFVRNTPENAALIHRLGLSCTVATIASADITSASSRGVQARRFEVLTNRASIFYVLGRDQDAYADLGSAQSIFNGDPNLHLLKAQLDQANGRLDDARREYQQSLILRPTDSAWFALAQLYATQKDYADALTALNASIGLSDEAYDRYRSLGRLYLLMNRPYDALRAFKQAERKSPFRGALSYMGADFNARIAEGEASAYKNLGDFGDAVAEQRAAVAFTPDNAPRWQQLGDIYAAVGQMQNSADAYHHAKDLSALGNNAPSR